MGKFVVFTVSDGEFGLGLERILEIIKPQKTTPLFNVPSFINGVINFRGTIIPVMDLRKRLNTEPSHQKERIIILRLHGEKIGLLVDSVKEIVNIEKTEIASPPSIFRGFKTEYLNDIGKIGERLILILNLDILLTSEEVMLLGSSSERISEKEEEQIA